MPKVKVQFKAIKLNGKASLEKKRVKSKYGNTVTVYTLDADSPNFARDLSAVFAKNVSAARVENFGLPSKKLKTAMQVAFSAKSKKTKARVSFAAKRKAIAKA